jgi:hypothetical protein
VLGAVVGCDQGAPATVDTIGPPPRVVWTYPANEAVDVPRTLTIRAQFDRFLMPATTVRQAMCLQAATVGGESTGTEHCVAAGFAPHYDPVDRVATWIIRGEIMPLTRYNVRIFAPRAPEDPNGIRAFDGAPLEKEFTFAFTTRPECRQSEPHCPTPIDTRPLGFCETKALCPLPVGACDGPTPTPVTTSPHDFLANNCTSGGSCHGAGGGGGPSGSVLRLDDDGAGGGFVAAIRRLVGQAVVASETATGPDPVIPSRNALAPFGRNMPYIDAPHPGNSYLLYKMILALSPRCPLDPTEETPTQVASACTPEGAYARGTYGEDFYDCKAIEDASVPRDPSGSCPDDGGFHAPMTKAGDRGALVSPMLEPWVPADRWQPPAPGEYERLRARIRGSGMPHGGVVTRAEALTLSYWIADGAQVRPCD